jgi:hypothetical protein
MTIHAQTRYGSRFGELCHAYAIVKRQYYVHKININLTAVGRTN